MPWYAFLLIFAAQVAGTVVGIGVALLWVEAIRREGRTGSGEG